MRFCISKVPKERNHTAIAIHSIINLTGEIWYLTKILVEMTFGEIFLQCVKYCKILKIGDESTVEVSEVMASRPSN
jgi:hypothetical protein